MGEKVKRKKAVSKSKDLVMQYTAKIEVPEAEKTLEQLEVEFDLAGARMIYAQSQKFYWDQEVYRRGGEFDTAAIKYKQKKRGFTDEQIQTNPPVPDSVWTYAK